MVSPDTLVLASSSVNIIMQPQHLTYNKGIRLTVCFIRLECKKNHIVPDLCRATNKKRQHNSVAVKEDTIANDWKDAYFCSFQ